MTPLTRIGLAALVVGAALACSDSTSPVTPGVATVSFVTPNTNDGAISLVLTGPGVTDVHPGSSAYAVFWRVVSASDQ